MLYEAYWVSPTGEAIGVGVTHIEKVIEDPSMFGVTIEYVREVYKKFDDPLGFEGLAREEIMMGLMKLGWIRFRYRPRCDGWFVELWELTPEKTGYIEKLKEKISTEEEKFRYSTLYIQDDR